MQYNKVYFELSAHEAYEQDLFISDLGDLGFDSFEVLPTGFNAFIQRALYQENELLALIAAQDFKVQHEMTEVPAENWNAEWEKNFSPLTIEGQCYVRATFHEARPDFPYEIIIDPKMSFGTGHHQTTSMMLKFILAQDLQGKDILDMGCGTAILAILAAKRGAAKVTAIDYDEVCVESAIENAQLNNIKDMKVLLGGKEVIPDGPYDMIFANINRNILLDQMDRYAAVLQNGGSLFLSGFYEDQDLEAIKLAAEAQHLQYVSHHKDAAWVAAHFIKSLN